MKLFYTPIGGTQLALHELGLIYINSQRSAFTPDEAAQRETRIITISVEFWETTFADNYDLLSQVRIGLKNKSGRMLWTDEDIEDDHGTKIADGPVYLNQDVTIIGEDVPEDPNSWGTTQQSITIQVRQEITDLAGDSHLKAEWEVRTYARNQLTIGSKVEIGNVYGFKTNYSSEYISKLRNIQDRSSGMVVMSGELLSNHALTETQRRTWLREKKAELDSAIQDRDGRLTYGPSSNRFFDQVVKCDSFEAVIDQAKFSIRWSLTGSYTIFPNEAGYAAADIRVKTSTDNETGDVTTVLSGTIGAATHTMAVAKLEAVRAAFVPSGFTPTNALTTETDAHYIDNDQADSFLQLSFNETYRKRGGNILSFTMQESEGDDTRTGLVSKVYSGSVTATASTDAAAYTAAVEMARTLGDNKHPFRMAANLTRNSRKIGTGSQEFVRLEFSFSYQVKGTRTYLEYASEATTETFGENTDQVSGFVVAKSLAAARDAYARVLRNGFNGRLIRNEKLTENSATIGEGSYGSEFQPSGKFATMGIRLDFSFSAHRQKGTTEYSFKYGIEVEIDHVSLVRQVSITGKFYGSSAYLIAAHAGTSGNKLDAFLEVLSLGVAKTSKRGIEYEKVGSSAEVPLSVAFASSYESVATSSAQILASDVSEEINYSGTRWVFKPTPDGNEVPQNCGHQRGERIVSGTVIAATETAGMAAVNRLRSLPFPTGTGGGATPGQRHLFPARIKRSWETLPLTEIKARGDGANARVSKIEFTFGEALIYFPFVS